LAETFKYTNKLLHETSPYLLQHAHNPVNWYPWGDEALAAAREEDKPIFLSVGYAACHWCHVMERESFENEEIAEILNKSFISIKVDREERPDLDEIYMSAVVAMNGGGGWPMTVFLAPDLKPFMGGTYFPPEDKWGRVGFKRLISRIGELWLDAAGRERLLKESETLMSVVEASTTGRGPGKSRTGDLNAALLTKAAEDLESSFDERWGGFGKAPKFPPHAAIQALLRDYFHTGNRRSLDMALFTLDKMYEGGLYDHLGGGFHRYSTDERWLVPHFEKMLYDNALLAIVYLEAYQLTSDERYSRVAREIFDYVLTRMTGPGGAFYSTEDADSEGREGTYYLWRYVEIEEILGEEDARLFAEAYSLRPEGNFSSHESYHQGLNILHMGSGLPKTEAKSGVSEQSLEETLAPLRRKLLAVREKRARPGLDDKIITSWNALMISAFAKGYQVLGETKYLKVSERAARFILEHMRTPEGNLYRTHRHGKSRFNAYLVDYAYMLQALIDLYESGFHSSWLSAARRLAEDMLSHFWDKESAGFFNTGEMHKNLIVRTKTMHDGAIPSPNGVAVRSVLRLARLLGKEDYEDKAIRTLEVYHEFMSQAPRGYLTLLSCVDDMVYPPKEVAVVGGRDSEDTLKLLRTVHRQYIPNRVLAFLDPGGEDAPKQIKRIPLLEGRDLVDGKAAAFVCENFACNKPVTSVKDLLRQLTHHGLVMSAQTER
jgi:uncharacterized protein YyaL (SSP411 family)